MTDDQTKALDEIRAERRRQVEAEGWTPEHDDTHTDGELLAAAVIYLHHGTEKEAPLRGDDLPMGWPWDAAWWKPKDRRRNIVRAGALALADNERRERAGLDEGPAVHKLKLAVRELAALSATDDQKPMSAEEVANKVINDFLDETADYKPYWANRLFNLAATALRDHAAEAVEAEREENAKIADRVSIKSSAMRSLDAKGRCDAADEIATDIRARTEVAKMSWGRSAPPPDDLQREPSADDYARKGATDANG